MSQLIAGAGLTLIAIGTIITLYYFGFWRYCNPSYSCGPLFIVEKIVGISFLAAGATLLILNYAKSHKKAAAKGRAARG
jgi:hypothetical protein